MVVVIVRDHHDVDGRHLAKRHGYGLETLRSEERGGRSPRTPHRVGEYPYAVDLDEQRRVSEPGDPQTASGLLIPRSERIHGRQRTPGYAPLAAAHEIRERGHRHGRVAQVRRYRMEVLKAIARPSRRCLHALQSRSVRAMPQGFHGGSLASDPGGSSGQSYQAGDLRTSRKNSMLWPIQSAAPVRLSSSSTFRRDSTVPAVFSSSGMRFSSRSSG